MLTSHRHALFNIAETSPVADQPGGAARPATTSP
jgi:hypothetical protein